MRIEVGDVWKVDGQVMRIESYVPEGEFQAQLQSVTTGEWTDYHIRGESIKLPMFLKVGHAELLERAGRQEGR